MAIQLAIQNEKFVRAAYTEFPFHNCILTLKFSPGRCSGNLNTTLRYMSRLYCRVLHSGGIQVI